MRALNPTNEAALYMVSASDLCQTTWSVDDRGSICLALISVVKAGK